MYPRNAASPEPIAIGPVVQISDGAVQTAGVTVRIKPVGVSEADGGGTTAYSTDGIVLYTPTQAETNYTSFVLIAKKTGCIPASVTVVTTASATAGYAGVDWSKVTSATSTVALTNTTINTSQVVASVTGAVGSVTARVTANTDQWGGVAVTGMPLPTASYTAPPSAATNATAVRSELSTELARIDVTASSRLAASSYVAPLSASDTRTALGLASANLDTQLADLPTVAEFEARTLAAAGYASSTHWTSTRAGYLDSVLLAANANRTVQVTGSNHVAADIHELQAAVITSAAFAAGWLTAAGTAADYITELQTALGTATNQTAILDRVSFALSALAGSCSDAQTATETYILSIGGNTYTVDYSGLDASGNRSTTTLTKA